MLFIPLVGLIVGGPMSMWPRIVLDFLFYFPQTSFTTGALASFLYENGLPLSMALHLVRVGHDGAKDTMLNQIDTFITKWTTSSDCHLVTFWNVRLQTFVWLNGPNGPRNEFLVHPYTTGDANGTVTGFDVSKYTAAIQ